MSRTSILIFIGALLLLVPFSGLPISIRSILTLILGACVLAIGLSLRVSEARNARLAAGTASAHEPVGMSQEVVRPDPHRVSPI